MSVFEHRLVKIGFITPEGVTAEFTVDEIKINNNGELYEFHYTDAVDVDFEDIVIQVNYTIFLSKFQPVIHF